MTRFRSPLINSKSVAPSGPLLWGFVLVALLATSGASVAQSGQRIRATPAPLSTVVVDDFETYGPGELPVRWKYLRGRRELVPLTQEDMRPRERFYVATDAANQVGRVYTEGEAVHLTMANGDGVLDWSVSEHPVLSWTWRASELPGGAREDIDRLNDTGAGVYVVFSVEGFLMKRPKAIKYTYSSSLPVGTVVDYGKLKVIVVSSARDGSGDWISVERDVVEDYRSVFGGSPPDRPLSIRLWGDSDNTKTAGEVDFDDIYLKSSRG